MIGDWLETVSASQTTPLVLTSSQHEHNNYQARSQDCQNEEADRSTAPPLPLLPSPPIPSPVFPSPSFPSRPLPSLPLEVGPLNPARGSGERCKLPQWGLGRSPSRNRIWCILVLKSGGNNFNDFPENQGIKFRAV